MRVKYMNKKKVIKTTHLSFEWHITFLVYKYLSLQQMTMICLSHVFCSQTSYSIESRHHRVHKF